MTVIPPLSAEDLARKARANGMMPEIYCELLAVVGMSNPSTALTTACQASAGEAFED